jgi:hypothetical protein
MRFILWATDRNETMRRLCIYLVKRRLTEQQRIFFTLFDKQCDIYYYLLALAIRGVPYDTFKLDASRAMKEAVKETCLRLNISPELLRLTDPL